LKLQVEGDAQDVDEEKVRKDARQTFDLINGTSMANGINEVKQNVANGPVIDWLNRTQRRQFAKSVVGTSQYMAPEVIRGENYDGRCDWWSIGIILYEVCHCILRRQVAFLTLLVVSIWKHTILLRQSTGYESAHHCR
jgi:protein-serine/threonine kinase